MRPGSRIYGNSVAVHQAIKMHQQSHQIAQQNMLRHTFAHLWLREGGGKTDLMRLTGWRSRAKDH